MLATFTPQRLESLGEHEVGDALEQGQIVFFPQCPFELPAAEDLEFLRAELPRQLQLKNVSYHPEADQVRGLSGSPDLYQRAYRVLTAHSERLQAFLTGVMPHLAERWTVGTSSFRPIQEQGRNLKSHASNELVHVDAGAYGATDGDRIFRFFVNVNPETDRVWASKRTFPDLYRRYGAEAGIAPACRPKHYLEKRPLDHLRTAFLRGLVKVGLPMAKVLDSSPYDRTMRRFHNFMKDTPAFQSDPEGHEEYRFPPLSAWMVFTDMVSHASVSGQHALVTTMLLRLENCRHSGLAPINILKAA